MLGPFLRDHYYLGIYSEELLRNPKGSRHVHSPTPPPRHPLVQPKGAHLVACCEFSVHEMDTQTAKIQAFRENN